MPQLRLRAGAVLRSDLSGRAVGKCVFEWAAGRRAPLGGGLQLCYGCCTAVNDRPRLTHDACCATHKDVRPDAPPANKCACCSSPTQVATNSIGELIKRFWVLVFMLEEHATN